MKSDTADIQPMSRGYWAIFGLTIFLSASLLFFVQPLFAKMVLPVLGGAPAVWTTAMLFFQSALILGYGYAHLLSRYLNVAAQIAVHACLWVIACISLPLAVDTGWQFDPTGPIAWQTLTLFAAGVGLPFVALSANAPLIQHWYSQLGTADSHNPYVLYGASNLGSLLSLLAFPLVAEPLFGARAISAGWAVFFVILGGALGLSGLTAARRTGLIPRLTHRQTTKTTASPDLRTFGKWLLLAFLPSSLMLVVTSKIATDFGSVPLVWVVPLALYLATFVLVFTQTPLFREGLLRILALLSIAVLLGIFAGGFTLSVSLVPAIVMSFFALALFAHAKLYASRPDSAHLTIFYLVMSVGGALGGLFNSVIAPAVFDDLHEGPVTLVLFALVLSQGRLSPRAVAAGVIAAIVFFTCITWVSEHDASRLLGAASLVLAVLLVLATARMAYSLPVFLVIAFSLNIASKGDLLLADRSFFGTHRVVERDGMRLYLNGTTLHGGQRVDDMDAGRPTPLAYYHALAPMGQLMASERVQATDRIGIVGLGVGALACYATPRQDWHFYEIDPMVHRIARHSGQFSYLGRCTPDASTHLGDARIVLQRHSDLTFDLLVIDAYSSDAVPVHLTTVEAIEMYFDRITPGGLLVMHISNRYFTLAPPIARIAEDLGLVARIQDYEGTGDPAIGDQPSIVMVLARDDAALGELANDPRWGPAMPGQAPPWTDDRANPLAALSILQ